MNPCVVKSCLCETGYVQKVAVERYVTVTRTIQMVLDIGVRYSGHSRFSSMSERFASSGKTSARDDGWGDGTHSKMVS